MAGRFFKYFPVPDYLRLPLIGLDLSNSHVRVVELVKKGGSVGLGRFGTHYVAKIGTKGEDKMRGILEALASIRDRYDIDRACISLPEEQAFFFNIKLPVLPDDQIRSSIELQLEEYIPFSPSEVIFDYQVLERNEGKPGYIVANVAVMPLEIVNQYVDVVTSAGIKPITLEVEASAAARAVVPRDSDDFYMLINIGSENTILSIVGKKAIWLSNTVPIGGSTFDAAIAKDTKKSIAESSKMKMNLGFTRKGGNEKVIEALTPLVSSIRDEISQHYKYWHSHDGASGQRIYKLLLCGSQAAIPGLGDYLSSSLGINVVLVDPWKNIFSYNNEIPELSYNEALGYTTAIGLAMTNIESEI
ncbi:MAG: pilus assembly protein PilM [Candidatus Paceibacterota bacterium]|jgi:type IV pilus assembly protein PilM